MNSAPPNNPPAFDPRIHLAAIVDSADDAIISKNLQGIITSWNEGARKIFGYTADEMVGQSILRLIPQQLHYEEEVILGKIRAGQRIDHYETTRQRKNGEPVEVSVTISPIRDSAGAVIGASKIARDISDRKRVQILMLQAEKLAATGRMAASIAHEINNPLESLMNIVYLARTYSQNDTKVYQLLLTAEGELERVAHIARQTLGYYKDTGSPAQVHIHDLLENVLTVYSSKMRTAGISVDSRFDDPQKIVVSKGEMLQCFSNIIANAIDAMPNGGQLSVSATQVSGPSGEGIQIAIQDSGCGIAQENLSGVFEPFFTTKGSLGTGIGLWVTRQLIEKRGGTIEIASSTAPRMSGTTLTIFIPYALPVVRTEIAEPQLRGTT